jgi:hypothetical protein
MHEVHDERSIPLQPEALPAREGYFFRLMAKLGLREKNLRDEKVAKAATTNAPIREAEARRTLSQPGVSPEAAEKALRVLSRVGAGGAK